MLLTKATDTTSDDDVLNHFLDQIFAADLELYDHQEEAILDLFAGNNVILNTPTGSGKSLVALALHFLAFSTGRTSYYTVPIKALANEKFLSLCQTFGADNVGMITGDATVNPTAPIICCTAEILSNIALRNGDKAHVHDVIMDEFHYYSDTDRGIAWQIPLLTLPQCRFLLMSATIGDTDFFINELTQLTGRATSLVQSDQRPVPLEFEYSEIPLSEKVAELVEQNKAPVYLVHFSQRATAESAQDLLSCNFCSKIEKQEIAEALHQANFRSPYGKEISKLLRHGIGIHHAGLLPKYRLLVEKLTQRGLLKVICGTDTLGVGINVPIRSVLFTQLCKFDGSGTKILSVRDFKQIAGRAGRRGFDDRGYVVAQAPEHVIENLRLEAKANASPKNKKFVKKKPPENGFVLWTQETFEKLQHSPSEKLKSSFLLQHSLLLNILSREHMDGCTELKRLIQSCHEPASSKRTLFRQARSMFIALVRGNILTIIPPTKRRPNGPKVQLHVDLQEDFTMNQTLGLYLLEAIPQLDSNSPDYALNLLSLIEAILENPAAILKAQINYKKSELIADLKNDGVDFDRRMELLDEVTHPMPGKEFIYTTFNRFAAKHPWMKSEYIRPKSIAREMFMDFFSFEDYIHRYKLERSEAILLRHLSEVYKVLSQTVPPAAKTPEVIEAEHYLRDHLTRVDSSLIDEWNLMRNPTADTPSTSKPDQPASIRPVDFSRRAHHACLELVKLLAHNKLDDFLARISPTSPNGERWSHAKLESILAEYDTDHYDICLNPEARNKKHFNLSGNNASWQARQTICDPDALNDWTLDVIISPDSQSNLADDNDLAITLCYLGPITDLG